MGHYASEMSVSETLSLEESREIAKRQMKRDAEIAANLSFVPLDLRKKEDLMNRILENSL